MPENFGNKFMFVKYHISLVFSAYFRILDV